MLSVGLEHQKYLDKAYLQIKKIQKKLAKAYLDTKGTLENLVRATLITGTYDILSWAKETQKKT